MTEPAPHRAKIYTVRLSDDEDAIAKRVAAHLGLPLSSAIRMLVLEKGRDLGITVPVPTATQATTTKTKATKEKKR